MTIVPLTVAELNGSAQIPTDKKSLLAALNANDFKTILAMDPFSATQSSSPNSSRWVFKQTLQVDGPDNPGDAIPGQGVAISGESSTTASNGWAFQVAGTATVDTGLNLLDIAKATASAGITFEWDYEKSVADANGIKQEVEVTLKTSTVGHHEAIDVYEDTAFKTLGFVSRSGPLQASAAALQGVVSDQSGKPIMNQPVTVTLSDGTKRTVFTNKDGIYRVFALPTGTLQVTAGNISRAASISQGHLESVAIQFH